MYVDSVYIKHFQEVAQLISPMTTAPMSGCLSFYYQLQQRNGNIFSVYTRDAAGLYEEIWKAGDPGNAVWNLAEVEFSAPYPKEVRVPGVPWPGHSAEMPPHPDVAQETLQPHTHPSSFVSQSPSPFSLPWPLPLFSLPLYSLCLPPLSLHFLEECFLIKTNMGKPVNQLDFLATLSLWTCTVVVWVQMRLVKLLLRESHSQTSAPDSSCEGSSYLREHSF